MPKEVPYLQPTCESGSAFRHLGDLGSKHVSSSVKWR